jgi:DNA-binding transcriptional MerR regulator
MARKLFYKIGEACKILDVQPYVLRYWETEFPLLKPDKSRSGQRVYSQREIDIIARIKQLLYDEGYTIAGAKKKLDGELEIAEDGSPILREEGAEATVTPTTSTTPPLDSNALERIETLERGVRAALREARSILAALEPTRR